VILWELLGKRKPSSNLRFKHASPLLNGSARDLTQKLAEPGSRLGNGQPCNAPMCEVADDLEVVGFGRKG